MVSDKDFLKMQSMYNLAIAKGQDLKETLETKEEQWEKQEENFATTEKLMRQLCEDILAKDPREMVLGADYSWSSIPINDLVLKARAVFRDYISKQKDFLKRLMDLAEERRLEIESLNEQISIMKANPSAAATLSQEEIKEKIDKEKKEQKILDQMSPELRKSVQEGKTQVVMEASDDIDDLEEDLMQAVANVGEQVKITQKSIPVTESKRRLEKKRERKERAVMTHTIDLKEYEDKMNDSTWLVMDAVGKEGYSRYSDIETYVMERESTLTKTKIRVASEILVNIGLLNKEPIRNPLKGNLFAYQMTDMGSRVFKDHYGNLPIASELDLIVAEHDNAVHGYGIRFISEMLRESEAFKEVDDMNRKKPINIGNNISYIPDIVCTDQNGAKMYMEYECANHTQTNFSAKCNKMTKVTSTLNFIAQNREAIGKLMKEVEAWISSRGEGKAIRHITVRITSAVQMKDMDLTKNKSWKVVYLPGKSKEPIINF